MKLPSPFIYVFFSLLLAPSGQGQEAQSPASQSAEFARESSDSVDLGGVTLRLGMGQDSVVQQLSEHYSIREIATPEATAAKNVPIESSWTVETKTGPPYVSVATLTFARGKLTLVRKWIGLYEPDTQAGFADPLFEAFMALQKESGGQCEATPGSVDESAAIVSIACGEGQKSLVIDIWRMPNGQHIPNLVELLGRIPNPSGPVLVAGPTSPSVSGESSNAGGASEAAQLDEELLDRSSLIKISLDQRLSDEELSKVAAHNRALCDQTITVAGLTPNGLALYVPPLGQKFMAKNSQNYPRMCLVEDATGFVPGVPRYLLVYAYSENAFSGFQAVTHVTASTTPVSGSGTVTDFYGDAWNFTYIGTVETTEMDTIEAPYVIRSHSLYLDAYDEKGRIVSSHSVTVSSQIGGNGASAIGYNGAQLIALLWNNPSHLIKSVLKDVQQDSRKYNRK